MTSLPGLHGEAACRPAVECYRRWQTTTPDAREHHQSGAPTLCVGGPVTMWAGSIVQSPHSKVLLKQSYCCQTSDVLSYVIWLQTLTTSNTSLRTSGVNFSPPFWYMNSCIFTVITASQLIFHVVVVLCPTRHKIGHFGDALLSQSLDLVLKNWNKYNKGEHASVTKYATT